MYWSPKMHKQWFYEKHTTTHCRKYYIYKMTPDLFEISSKHILRVISHYEIYYYVIQFCKWLKWDEKLKVIYFYLVKILFNKNNENINEIILSNLGMKWTD